MPSYHAKFGISKCIPQSKKRPKWALIILGLAVAPTRMPRGQEACGDLRANPASRAAGSLCRLSTSLRLSRLDSQRRRSLIFVLCGADGDRTTSPPGHPPGVPLSELRPRIRFRLLPPRPTRPRLSWGLSSQDHLKPCACRCAAVIVADGTVQGESTMPSGVNSRPAKRIHPKIRRTSQLYRAGRRAAQEVHPKYSTAVLILQPSQPLHAEFTIFACYTRLRRV